MKGAKKRGEVILRFYEYPDGTWHIKVVAHEKGNPDKEKDTRAWLKMGLITAQLRQDAQERCRATDMLLVSNEEIEAIKDMMDNQKRRQADVDLLQRPLPFKEDE